MASTVIAIAFPYLRELLCEPLNKNQQIRLSLAQATVFKVDEFLHEPADELYVRYPLAIVLVFLTQSLEHLGQAYFKGRTKLLE